MGNCSSNSSKKQYAKDEPTEFDFQVPEGLHAMHEGSLLSIVTDMNGQIFTCSDDKRVAVINRDKLVSTKDYKPFYLSGHKKAVNRMVYSCNEDYHKHLWSVSRDLSIKQVSNVIYC